MPYSHLKNNDDVSKKRRSGGATFRRQRTKGDARVGCRPRGVAALSPVSPAAPELPSAKAYCKWGISVKGLKHVQNQISSSASNDSDDASVIGRTTTDICHKVVKPMTVPEGWTLNVELDTETKRWTSTYKNTATGVEQRNAPNRTCSLCELLSAETTSGKKNVLVGKPSVFLSHAWASSFSQLVDILEYFCCSSGNVDAEETFFWIDIFSVDQHRAQQMPSEWWDSTFKEAVGNIGHTVPANCTQRWPAAHGLLSVQLRTPAPCLVICMTHRSIAARVMILWCS